MSFICCLVSHCPSSITCKSVFKCVRVKQLVYKLMTGNSPFMYCSNYRFFHVSHRYFKKPLNIFLGFIPEIVFMSSLFGYLVLLIFYKWMAYDAVTSKDAPSLLIAFINMCLFNYNDPTNKPLYRGQVTHTFTQKK